MLEQLTAGGLQDGHDRHHASQEFQKESSQAEPEDTDGEKAAGREDLVLADVEESVGPKTRSRQPADLADRHQSPLAAAQAELRDEHKKEDVEQTHVEQTPVRQRSFQPLKRGLTEMLLDGVARQIVRQDTVRYEKSVERSWQVLCGGFPRSSPLRKSCFMLHRSQGWRTFHLVLILASFMCIALIPDSADDEEDQQRIATLNVLGSTFLCFLGLEIAVGTIALGFSGARDAWLTCNGYHKLDGAVFLASVIEKFVSALGYDTITVVPFRLLRIFHVLSIMKPFAGVQHMVLTLVEGQGQLLTVFATFAAMLLTFSIVGMAMFQRSFRRRCVVPGLLGHDGARDGTGREMGELEGLYANSVVVTGGYPFYEACKIVYNESVGQYDESYALDDRGRYHTCQLDDFRDGLAVSQRCEEVANPQAFFGFAHFDHLGAAMLVMLQTSVPDSFQDILHLALQSERTTPLMTWAFFLLLTALCTLLMAGLLVAVVTGTFSRVRQQHASAAHAPSPAAQAPAAPPSRMTNAILPSWSSSAALLKSADVAVTTRRSLLPLMVSHRRLEPAAAQAGLRPWAARLVRNRAVGHVMAAVAVVHGAALAQDRIGVEEGERLLWRRVAICCCAVCAVETALKVVRWDSVAAAREDKLTLSHLLLSILGVAGHLLDSQVLIHSQALWLLRAGRYVPMIEALLHRAGRAAPSILNVCLFTAIWGTCVAVTGHHLFGSSMDALTRSNFGSLSIAAYTTLQLYTGDQWSNVLYSAMEATHQNPRQQAFAVVFILVWFLFAQFVIVNMFTAVIIEQFQLHEILSQAAEKQEAPAFRVVWSRLTSFWNALNQRRSAGPVRNQMGNRIADESVDGELRVTIARDRALVSTMGQPPAVEEDVGSEFKSVLVRATTAKMLASTSSGFDPEQNQHHEVPNRALGCLSMSNPIRRLCIRLDQDSVFNALVIAAILASCFLLIIAPPTDDLPGFNHVLPPATIKSWNLIFTVVFTVECLVRVVSHGLLFSEGAYLRSKWNITDVLILIFAWMEETDAIPTAGVAKIFRLARAFRPLRLMKRNRGMRTLVDALVEALAPISYVILFSIFTSIAFGLIGTAIFGGLFFSCSTPDAAFPLGRAACSGLYWDPARGVLVQRSWINARHNFDDIFEACSTLLQVATLKYVGVLQDAMDVTSYGQSPLPNASKGLGLFFVVYVIFGRFFLYNLTVAFVVDSFHASKGSSQASIAFNRLLRQLRLHKPPSSRCRPWQNGFSSTLRLVLRSNQFQTFSTACIMCNVILMLADHADKTQTFSDLLYVQNLVFFAELCLEVALQLLAYGPVAFFQNSWRCFDFAVALGTMSGYVSGERRVADFAKSFRLMRVVRLMTLLQPVRVVLETLMACIPQLFNVFLLVLLVYAIFAALAVQLFGVTKYGARLGPTANFESWGAAMATCYQLLMSDEWMDIQDDCWIQPPFCTQRFDKAHVFGYSGQEYAFGDCGMRYATLFFVLFKVFCEAVLLNLFVGLALENFTFVTDEVAHLEDELWSKGASAAQMKALADTFRQLDGGTGSIPLSSLHALLHQLPRPVGFRSTLHAGVAATDLVTREDLAAYKLIRAELNVIVRDRRHREQGRGQHAGGGGWLRGMSYQGVLAATERVQRAVGYRKGFVEGVDFEEVMKAIVMWRVPHLVPEELLVLRSGWIRQEVVPMMHALLLRDFMLWHQCHAKLALSAAQRSPPDATAGAAKSAIPNCAPTQVSRVELVGEGRVTGDGAAVPLALAVVDGEQRSVRPPVRSNTASSVVTEQLAEEPSGRSSASPPSLPSSLEEASGRGRHDNVPTTLHTPAASSVAAIPVQGVNDLGWDAGHPC